MKKCSDETYWSFFLPQWSLEALLPPFVPCVVNFDGDLLTACRDSRRERFG